MAIDPKKILPVGLDVLVDSGQINLSDYELVGLNKVVIVTTGIGVRGIIPGEDPKLEFAKVVPDNTYGVVEYRQSTGTLGDCGHVVYLEGVALVRKDNVFGK